MIEINGNNNFKKRDFMNLFVGNRTSFLKPLHQNALNDVLIITRKRSRLDEYGRSHNLEIENFTDRDSLIRILKRIQFDTLYSAGCPFVLPSELINFPNKKCINIHPSMLPSYAGIHSITEAMFNGGPYGVTIHTMGKKADSGRIIAQREVHLPENLSAANTYEVMFEEEEKLVQESLRKNLFNYQDESSLPLIRLLPDSVKFRRDFSFRKIDSQMTIEEIKKRVLILNVKNHHAFIEREGQRIYIHRTFTELDSISEKNEKVIIFEAKNGLIGLSEA